MERKNLNSRIDAKLFKALKAESERLGMKFERFIEERLRTDLAATAGYGSTTVRKIGTPSAER